MSEPHHIPIKFTVSTPNGYYNSHLQDNSIINLSDLEKTIETSERNITPGRSFKRQRILNGDDLLPDVDNYQNVGPSPSPQNITFIAKH
ncbi:MAG: hypothetical protein ACRDDF_02360 [Aeromonas sp.]